MKVAKVSSATVGGETVTQSDIVMNKPGVVDQFVQKIDDLEVVRKIDACSRRIANTDTTPKVRDALLGNNIKISVFMNTDKVIKKISLSAGGKKSTVQLSAEFKYTAAQPVAKPADAVSAGTFIRKMTTLTSASDQTKESDLNKINLAIEKYITRNGGRLLPASLKDLQIPNLGGPLSDYEYTYNSRTTGGGPTLTYQTCTRFQYPGYSEFDTYYHNISLQTFTMHGPTKSCFENGYYKGSSHIRLVTL
jgi:hypothetical protein